MADVTTWPANGVRGQARCWGGERVYRAYGAGPRDATEKEGVIGSDGLVGNWIEAYREPRGLVAVQDLCRKEAMVEKDVVGLGAGRRAAVEGRGRTEIERKLPPTS